MNETLEAALSSLERHITAQLDLIHDLAIANFDRLARQVGQWTRVDRL